MVQSVRFYWLVAIATVLLAAGCQRNRNPTITLSVVGTNDVHGALLPVDGNRGLPLFAGYVANLRETRAQDGGFVLLIDAGDMWQGTLESNLSEGASVVAAFNEIGYDAAAVGNHEFDFGPVGQKATPEDNDDDAQGALKQRATEAEFPLLAANLIDQRTGHPVAWPNVQPSVLIERNDIKIGILGLMTEYALIASIAANTRGLSVAPLSFAATREARKLHQSGADLIIITAHAGGTCENFDDPLDLSSCNLSDEIIRLALDLPAGLVDHIIAGHFHQGIAHEVNGIAITSSYSRTAAFGRVDFEIDRQDRTVVSRKIFPPQHICGYVDNSSGECMADEDVSGAAQVARYSGKVVSPDADVMEIAEVAAQRASELKSEELGVYLESSISREGRSNSVIGHLFTDIVLDAVGGDIVIHNVVGGIRADLPPGDLTYGAVYEMYPFDNAVTQLDLSGAQLREVLERQALRDPRAGFSGIRVFAACNDDKLELTMIRPDGTEIADDEMLVVTTTDFLATGGDDIFTTIIPDDGFRIENNLPLMREAIADWFRQRGGNLGADDFSDSDSPKWNLPDPLPATCTL